MNDISLSLPGESVHKSKVQDHWNDQKWNWKKTLQNLNSVRRFPLHTYMPFFNVMPEIHYFDSNVQKLNAQKNFSGVDIATMRFEWLDSINANASIEYTANTGSTLLLVLR